MKIHLPQLSYHLRVMLTYIFAVSLAQVVPVGIFYEWGWHEPFFNELTINHFLRVLLFLPWMIIAWLIIYDGYPTGMAKSRFFFHALGWLILGLMFAVLAELSQFFLIYRSYSRTDIILSCAGIAAGSMILLFHPRNVWKRITSRILKNHR